MKDYLKLIIGMLALGYLIYAVQKDFGSKKNKEKEMPSVAVNFSAINNWGNIYLPVSKR